MTEIEELKLRIEDLETALKLVDSMNKTIAIKMDYDYENSTMHQTIKIALNNSIIHI